MDLFGTFLKETPSFRGKWRLERVWQAKIHTAERTGYLPNGTSVETNLSIPYERQVWLKAEEWNELIFLGRLLSPGDCFIDVGANIGLWTLTAAGAVGATGHVVSFEPNPSTFAKLERNVARNNMQGFVSLYPCAVSAESGQAQFSCKADHNVSHLVEEGDVDTISVEVIALDSIIENITSKRITGIKIDTEGHELETLKGAEQIIREHSPWLIVEFNTTLLPSTLLAGWSVYDYLTARGYRAWTYDKSSFHAVVRDFAISGYTNICFRKTAGPLRKQGSF